MRVNTRTIISFFCTVHLITCRRDLLCFYFLQKKIWCGEQGIMEMPSYTRRLWIWPHLLVIIYRKYIHDSFSTGCPFMWYTFWVLSLLFLHVSDLLCVLSVDVYNLCAPSCVWLNAHTHTYLWWVFIIQKTIYVYMVVWIIMFAVNKIPLVVWKALNKMWSYYALLILVGEVKCDFFHW